MVLEQIKKLRCWLVDQDWSALLLNISQTLGVDIFLVGGLIRDRILGRETQDVDLTLSHQALQAGRLFANQTGGTFILLREEGEMARVVIQDRIFDFANFRGPDLQTDLRNRDFTLNAISLSLTQAFASGEWLPYDPLKGLSDLKDRILRMASPASFPQDPLRMLRAFRLAAQLGLEMDSATLQAINIQAPALTRSAPERIRYEWMLLLSQPEGFISILGMEETGLLGIIFPELVPLKGVMQGRFHHLDVFQHSLLTVKLLEQITQEKIPLPADLRREVISYLQQKGKLAYLKWAALMHDLGKATTAREKDGHQTFYGHAEESQRQFDPLADRLKLSNLEKIFFQKLLGGHMRPFSLAQEKGRGTLTGRALKRFVRDTAEEVNGFFLLALADSLAAQGTEKPPDFEERLLEVWRRALQIKEEWFPVRTPRPPLITGKDLIDLGLKPGPLFKVLLSEIQEEHWEGKVRSKEEALSWVKKRIGSG